MSGPGISSLVPGPRATATLGKEIDQRRLLPPEVSVERLRVSVKASRKRLTLVAVLHARTSHRGSQKVCGVGIDGVLS